MTDADTPATRAVDISIEIDAPAEAVWQAITDGEQLIRWFPPIASVKPGEGGHVTVAWEPGAEWTSRIVTWKPGQHLRLQDDPPPGSEGTPVTMAIDYFLEGKGDTTVVRIVHSGFSAGEEWDDHFHMTDNGWTFFLWNLKHYLERHRGIPRTMISQRPWVSGSREDVWDQVFGEGGIGEATRPGEAFRFDVAGLMLTGTTILSDRPWGYAGMVESLNDGVLHVEMEGSGEKWKMGVWLSAYGVDDAQTERAKEALQAWVSGLDSPAADDGS